MIYLIPKVQKSLQLHTYIDSFWVYMELNSVSSVVAPQNCLWIGKIYKKMRTHQCYVKPHAKFDYRKYAKFAYHRHSNVQHAHLDMSPVSLVQIVIQYHGVVNSQLNQLQ